MFICNNISQYYSFYNYQINAAFVNIEEKIITDTKLFNSSVSVNDMCFYSQRTFCFPT